MFFHLSHWKCAKHFLFTGKVRFCLHAHPTPKHISFRVLQTKNKWSVVQLDQDEELGWMRGMSGTLGVGLEVQRPIKRAELTALSCLFKVFVPSMVHVDDKGIMDGLWNERCNVLDRQQNTRICGSKFERNSIICAQMKY